MEHQIYTRPNQPAEAAKMQIKSLNWLLSGEESFKALMLAVETMKLKAPPDCDILIQAFGLNVTEVNYVAPHVLIFNGYDSESNPACAACHFTQLVAHVIFAQTKGETRVITGFAKTDAT